jgi:tRNA (guanosine-2'-O-)-methyltransferase
MQRPVTKEREQKFRSTIAKRQSDLTVVLENVNDPHNIGAVMRSCDAVGISEIYIVYTDENRNRSRKYIGNNSASGAKKWVKAHFYNDLESCFGDVRKKYDKIYGTHLDSDSVSLFELNMNEAVALVFGNEQRGISENALKYLDGNFIIPQHGMVQSLNISVACAVTLFEASRQRTLEKKYDQPFDDLNPKHNEMYEVFLDQHYLYIPDKSE